MGPVDFRGPWRIDGEFDAEVGVSIVDRDGGEICELYPAAGDWSEREIAVARLIAGAAEMEAVGC